MLLIITKKLLCANAKGGDTAVHLLAKRLNSPLTDN